MTTQEEHDQLQRHKRDMSRERYEAGRPEVVRRYRETAALAKGKTLDIGCAQALLGELLGGRSDVSYTGVDNWDEVLRHAPEYLDIRHCDADALPFGDGEFDTVILGQVLEHVYQIAPVVDEAMRVLRTGGKLIVNVPNNDVAPVGLHVRTFTLYGLLSEFGARVIWQEAYAMNPYWFAWGYKA